MQIKHKEKYIKMGKKIKYYRILKGYTRTELARQIGKKHSFIKQIEEQTEIKGMSVETLFRIAKVLDIEPYQMLEE